MNDIEIKKMRASLGLSQEGLANLIGVSWTTLSRWERGLSKPSNMAVRKIKELLQEQPKK